MHRFDRGISCLSKNEIEYGSNILPPDGIRNTSDREYVQIIVFPIILKHDPFEDGTQQYLDMI